METISILPEEGNLKPEIKEIMEQNRIILEMNKVLLKGILKPSLIVSQKRGE